MKKMGVKFPLAWFPTFAFSLTYFLCNLVLMFIFNAYVFPPVTYIICLNSVTILGWRTEGSVESLTVCGENNLLSDSDQAIRSLLSSGETSLYLIAI